MPPPQKQHVDAMMEVLPTWLIPDDDDELDAMLRAAADLAAYLGTHACLDKIFSSSYGASFLASYGAFSQAELLANSKNIRQLACKAVDMFVQYNLYPLLINCLTEGDEISATVQDGIKHLAEIPKGIDIIFPPNGRGSVQLDKVAAQSPSLARIWILSLIAKLFAVSSYTATAIRDSNLVSLFENEIKDRRDMLKTLGALEVLCELGQHPHSNEFLLKTNLLQLIADVINDSLADSIVWSMTVVISGRLLSSANAFTAIDQSYITILLLAINKILKMEESQDLDEIESALEALALIAAATLMFLYGLIKYGERTQALQCASRDHIARSSLWRPAIDYGRHVRENQDTEEILLRAQYTLRTIKITYGTSQLLGARSYNNGFGRHVPSLMYMYEVVEMELSLMYDILYTKATVIHTWYGCCIRIISLLCVVAAFLLFQFSNKDAYRRVDVTVTYVLFGGTLILEVFASIWVAGSSWACVSLHYRGWLRLSDAVMRLCQLLKIGNRRRVGMDSLGQFNMMELCTTSRDTSDMRAKIAKAMGLDDWWNVLRYSTIVSISQDIKAFVLEEIQKRSNIEELRDSWGRWTLEKMGIYEDLIGMINNIDMD
ncbi:hypothetical protein ABZP36_004400 [Zizania latifolia]